MRLGDTTLPYQPDCLPAPPSPLGSRTRFDQLPEFLSAMPPGAVVIVPAVYFLMNLSPVEDLLRVQQLHTK